MPGALTSQRLLAVQKAVYEGAEEQLNVAEQQAAQFLLDNPQDGA